MPIGNKFTAIGRTLERGQMLAGDITKGIKERKEAKKTEEERAAVASQLPSPLQKSLAGAGQFGLATNLLGQQRGFGETLRKEGRADEQAQAAAKAASEEKFQSEEDLMQRLESRLESLKTSLEEDKDFMSSKLGTAYVAAKDRLKVAVDDKAADKASKEAIDIYSKYQEDKAKAEAAKGKKEAEEKKGKGAKRLTAEASSKVALLRNGYDALQRLREVLASPEFDAVDLSDVGRIKNREVQSLMNRLVEGIARPHTGAAINEGEEKRFKQMLPRTADFLDPKVMEKKLKAVEDEFVTTIEGIINQPYKSYLSSISEEGRRLHPAERIFIGSSTESLPKEQQTPERDFGKEYDF